MPRAIVTIDRYRGRLITTRFVGSTPTEALQQAQGFARASIRNGETLAYTTPRYAEYWASSYRRQGRDRPHTSGRVSVRMVEDDDHTLIFRNRIWPRPEPPITTFSMRYGYGAMRSVPEREYPPEW